MDDLTGSRAESYEEQRSLLPRWWAVIDVYLVYLTRLSLFTIGIIFCVFVFSEVISRYLFAFSIFFVNAGAAMLVPWFFFLGAGIALREGIHLGISSVVNALPPRGRKGAILLAGAFSTVYFVIVLVGSVRLLPYGLTMVEQSLGIYFIWGFASIPISFGLLIYHIVTLMTGTWRRPAMELK